MISGLRPEYLRPDLGDVFSYHWVQEFTNIYDDSLLVLELMDYLNSRGPTTADELRDEIVRRRKSKSVRILSPDPTLMRR